MTEEELRGLDTGRQPCMQLYGWIVHKDIAYQLLMALLGFYFAVPLQETSLCIGGTDSAWLEDWAPQQSTRGAERPLHRQGANP